MRAAGQLQEDVLQVGLLGEDIDDGQSGAGDRGKDFRDRAVAGAVLEPETARAQEFGSETAERLGYLRQVLGQKQGQLLVVQPAQSPTKRLKRVRLKTYSQ